MKGGEPMNAIALLLQQMQPPKGRMDNPNQIIPETEGFVFQSLLNNEQAIEMNGVLPEALLSDTGGPIISDTDAITEEDVTKEAQPHLLNLMMDIFRPEDWQVVALENELADDVDRIENDHPGLNLELLQAVQGQLVSEESPEVKQQFTEIFTKMEALLSQITGKQDVAKIAPQILQLLQQWSDLEKTSGASKGIEQVLVVEDLEETKDGERVKELIQAFNKREHLAEKQQYHAAATVTTKDVSKWIHMALEEHSQSDPIIKHPAVTNTTLPMSKLEQFMIHINESQPLPSDKQLLEQFQAVLKSSAFLAKTNGMNQLSITLKPHNLGEMMVRLTEVDGEMTVKIIVNSHAAKNMLESNMHQLRNMFSPQQVVIEKQELALQQGQDVEREQKDQQLKDQEQSQSGHSNQDERENADTDDDFAAQFHELLMNEKV